MHGMPSKNSRNKKIKKRNSSLDLGMGGVGRQQFRDGVVLRMCCGLTITLFVRFFDRYYVATIPKSRIEFVRFLFNSCLSDYSTIS